MYIISKYKDFFDGVVGTVGVDKSIVYERETIDVDLDKAPDFFKRKNEYYGFSRNNTFDKISYFSVKKEHRSLFDEHAFFIVGFCGKLYIGWKLYTIDVSKFNQNVDTKITYDNEYIKTILEPKSYNGTLVDNINYVLNYDALPIFRELNSPIFVYDSDYKRTYINKDRLSYNHFNPRFFINPLLKEYEFYKVFDSFQAFQEVSMFMGGVLGKGEKDIVEVADKYKIGQHGFDKWSFRKEPENIK